MSKLQKFGMACGLMVQLFSGSIAMAETVSVVFEGDESNSTSTDRFTDSRQNCIDEAVRTILSRLYLDCVGNHPQAPCHELNFASFTEIEVLSDYQNRYTTECRVRVHKTLEVPVPKSVPVSKSMPVPRRK